MNPIEFAGTVGFMLAGTVLSVFALQLLGWLWAAELDDLLLGRPCHVSESGEKETVWRAFGKRRLWFYLVFTLAVWIVGTAYRTRIEDLPVEALIVAPPWKLLDGDMPGANVLSSDKAAVYAGEIALSSLFPCFLRLAGVLWNPSLIRGPILTLFFAVVAGMLGMAAFPQVGMAIVRTRVPEIGDALLAAALTIVFGCLNGFVTELSLSRWPWRWGRSPGDPAGFGTHTCILCGQRVVPTVVERSKRRRYVLEPCPTPEHAECQYNLRHDTAGWVDGS